MWQALFPEGWAWMLKNKPCNVPLLMKNGTEILPAIYTPILIWNDVRMAKSARHPLQPPLGQCSLIQLHLTSHARARVCVCVRGDTVAELCLD
jgi:hypothetical protein